MILKQRNSNRYTDDILYFITKVTVTRGMSNRKNLMKILKKK